MKNTSCLRLQIQILITKNGKSVNASAFNFDDFFDRSLSASTDSHRLNDLFQLRYRNWTKDFFTSIQPSFQGAPFVTSSINMSDFGLSTVSSDSYLFDF